MKEFQGKKIEGEWWLPKEPQVKFKGYLEINENNHGTLTLTEPIDALRKFWPEDLVTIFGVLESSYSYKITIFRAGVKSTSFGNKASVKLFTNTLLISEHIASEDEEIIYAAYGRLTGLSEWCDTSGISGNVDIGAKYGEEKLKLTYKAHDPPPIKESRSGVNPDRFWTIYRRFINGTEALYGGTDYRLSASG